MKLFVMKWMRNNICIQSLSVAVELASSALDTELLKPDMYIVWKQVYVMSVVMFMQTAVCLGWWL